MFSRSKTNFSINSDYSLEVDLIISSVYEMLKFKYIIKSSRIFYNCNNIKFNHHQYTCCKFFIFYSIVITENSFELMFAIIYNGFFFIQYNKYT